MQAVVISMERREIFQNLVSKEVKLGNYVGYSPFALQHHFLPFFAHLCALEGG